MLKERLIRPDDRGKSPSDELSVADIRRLCPLITCEPQAGDVLLTRGRGIEARTISALTQGRYSHAAIWLPVPIPPEIEHLTHTKPLVLLEADDHGTGDTILRRISAYRADGTFFEAFALGPETVYATLLRHPRMAAVPEEQISRATQELRSTELYRAYSDISRLAGTLKLPTAVEAAITRLVDLRYRPSEPGLSGSFCSELIAKFYDLLGLDLFIPSRSSRSIAPNHFLSPACSLRELEHVVSESSSVPHLHEMRLHIPFESQERSVILPVMVRNRRMHAQVERSFELVRSTVDNLLAGNLAIARKVVGGYRAQALGALANARDWGDQQAHRRISEFAAMQDLLSLSLDNFPEPVSREESLINGEVLARIIDISAETAHRCSLTSFLMQMRVARQIYLRCERDPAARKALRKIQKVCSDAWRNAKSSRNQTLAFNRDVSIYKTLSEQQLKTAGDLFLSLIRDSVETLGSRSVEAARHDRESEQVPG